MKHENIVKIYHQDTDCYGPVWHGAYLKWLEVGRVELSQMMGIDFKELEKMDVILPVVELNCRYKSPARLMDEILITTTLGKLSKVSVTFSSTITNIKTGITVLNADVTLVTADKNGKLYRKMPDYLWAKYNKFVQTESILNV